MSDNNQSVIDTIRLFQATLQSNATEYNRGLCAGIDLVLKALKFGETEVGTGMHIQIVSYSKDKIQVIRLIRQYSGMGLSEAKQASENLPYTFPTMTRDEEKSCCKELFAHNVNFQWV